MMSNNNLPAFTELNLLSSELNGSKILFATDDWFAPAENLLKEEEPVFKHDIFTEYGKWMDGWETRRKRLPGHDWCIIKLGTPGIIRGIEVDTAFFTGNYTPKFSIQGVHIKGEINLPKRKLDMTGTAPTSEMIAAVKTLNSESWEELLTMTPLRSGDEETRHNYFKIKSNESYTHIRLNMYPDGGIARLRVYGEVSLNLNNSSKMVDLISLINGGVCKGYSNAHYGHPRNLIKTLPGKSMADGWETARRLDRPSILKTDENGILELPGNEWAVFKLGAVGYVKHIQIDTAFFKGNFPDSVKIEGLHMKSPIYWNKENIEKLQWQTILSPKKLYAHQLHDYEDAVIEHGPFSHIKITIAPDGGVSRLRIYGNVA